jgi:signal transduction histidine kinase
MQEMQARDLASVGAASACREVARLLGAARVGAVSSSHAPVEDVLEGRVEGLIVFPLLDGATEGRASGSPTPGGVGPIERALEAARSSLTSPNTTDIDLVTAVAASIEANELFFLRESRGRVRVTAAHGASPPPILPEEIATQLRVPSPAAPVDDGTARQLAAVLGARSPRIASARTGEARGVELALAGWSSAQVVSSDLDRGREGILDGVARILALGHDLIAGRHAAAESRLRRDRVRWAGEIHDGLTQAVTAAFLELQTLAMRIPSDPQGAVTSLEEVVDGVRRSLLDVRGVLFDLTESADVETEDAITSFVHDVGKRWNLPIVADVRASGEPVSPATLAVARLVVREAIANAGKHAEAAGARIIVSAVGRTFRVEIEDDGCGFAVDQAGPRPGHLGLAMMRERVAEIGGALEIHSQPGHGTRVVASLPVGEQGEVR